MTNNYCHTGIPNTNQCLCHCHSNGAVWTTQACWCQCRHKQSSAPIAPPNQPIAPHASEEAQLPTPDTWKKFVTEDELVISENAIEKQINQLSQAFGDQYRITKTEIENLESDMQQLKDHTIKPMNVCIKDLESEKLTNEIFRKAIDKTLCKYDAEFKDLHEHFDELERVIYPVGSMKLNPQYYRDKIEELQKQINEIKEHGVSVRWYDKANSSIHRLNERVNTFDDRITAIDKNCDDACAENGQAIKKLEQSRKAHSQSNTDLFERVVKLEKSGFPDMKNELIAFKIERNELRDFRVAVDKSMCAIDQSLKSYDKRIVALEKLISKDINSDMIAKDIKKEPYPENFIDYLKYDMAKNVDWEKHATDVKAVSGIDIKKPKKTTGLSFEEAIVAFRQGKIIKRNDWHNGYALAKDSSNDLCCEDLQATDWEIVE